MKRCALLLLAACGAGGANGTYPDAPAGGDAAGGGDAGCQTVIAFDPPMPILEPNLTIRAQAQVFGNIGVPSYTWSIMHDNADVPTTPASPDGSQVDFVAPTTGPYYVRVMVGGGSSCGDGFSTLTVNGPGAQYTDYRLRVIPPPTAGAPPQERVIQVQEGTNSSIPYALDPGVPVTGTVKNGATGVAAYLRFMPAASPKGYVETFSSSSGAYSTRLLGQNHQVLVVPMAPGLAPALVPWDLSTQTLNVSAGNAVTGTVKDGAGNPLAGAQVQLTEHTSGVPSTLATTASDGSYTVRTSLPATSGFDVHVVPPPGRGLTVLDPFSIPGPTISIQYASLPVCDLAGTPVMRGSTPQPGAHVTVVGAFVNVATVGSANAAGLARISATADGAGHLPSMVVPRTVVKVVVDLGGGDLAVTSLDASSCSGLTINAPAMTTASGIAEDAGAHPLAGARIEAVPTGDLRIAGAPRIEAVSDSTGAFALPMAAGGRYDVTFSDPRGHSAPLVITDANAAAIPMTAMLAKALTITGTVSVIGNANPIIGASVQVLCLACGPATPPIAEAATTVTSTYSLGIPDPGTM
jgi:hypothetical protein